VLAHTHDGDKVPVTSHRINFGDTLDGGKVRAKVSESLARGLDEDESGEHGIECIGLLRTVRDREAPGSNPGPPTKFIFKPDDFGGCLSPAEHAAEI
jgi:hypothetical protein